jgi:endonuclease/exonuclease/phosphatase family metal-dependent hydrolase
VKPRIAVILGIISAGLVLTHPADVSTGKPDTAPGISVLSLNLAKVASADLIYEELRKLDAFHTADIILLQEVILPAGSPNSVGEQLAKMMDFQVVFAPAFRLNETTREGLAILSRYPLRDPKVVPLKPHNLKFRTRKRILLEATVDAPSGPIRVLNAHLDTRINGSDRVEQLHPLIDEAAAFPGPKIIGGDFNTNNMRWFYSLIPIPYAHKQATIVQRFMEKHGFRCPIPLEQSTFDFLGMHLDWIFTDKLPTHGSGVQSIKFSDHHAVWARFGLEQSIAGGSASR